MIDTAGILVSPYAAGSPAVVGARPAQVPRGLRRRAVGYDALHARRRQTAGQTRSPRSYGRVLVIAVGTPGALISIPFDAMCAPPIRVGWRRHLAREGTTLRAASASRGILTRRPRRRLAGLLPARARPAARHGQQHDAEGQQREFESQRHREHDQRDGQLNQHERQAHGALAHGDHQFLRQPSNIPTSGRRRSTDTHAAAAQQATQADGEALRRRARHRSSRRRRPRRPTRRGSGGPPLPAPSPPYFFRSDDVGSFFFNCWTRSCKACWACAKSSLSSTVARALRSPISIKAASTYFLACFSYSVGILS